VGTVVLLVRPRSGEGDPLSLAVGVEVIVDELAAIVGVQTQEGKRESLGDMMHSASHPVLTLTPDPTAFYPACGHIHGAQAGEIETFGTLAAVCHQVHFEETGAVLIPVGKGANGYGRLIPISVEETIRKLDVVWACNYPSSKSSVIGG